VQIRISARHGHLGEAAQAKIEAKVSKLVKLFERLTEITVTIDLEHPDEVGVDLRVSAEHKHDFVATTRAEDLIKALDLAMPKIEQQLRKYKEKVQDHHRKTGTQEQDSSLSPE